MHSKPVQFKSFDQLLNSWKKIEVENTQEPIVVTQDLAFALPIYLMPHFYSILALHKSHGHEDVKQKWHDTFAYNGLYM